MARSDVPFCTIGFGPNALVTTGGLMTVNVAVLDATPLYPPVGKVTAPTGTVFGYDPPVLLVTLTVTVQLPEAGIVPPLIDTEFPPAAAVAVPPVQVVLAPGAEAFTSPAG